MPAPTTDSLVSRAAALPTDLRLQLEHLKDAIERIVDGAALGCEAALCLIRFEPLVTLLIQQDLPVQAHDLRQAINHLRDAALIWEETPFAAVQDEYDRLVSEAHDRVSAALEAELPIHAPAPIAQAA